MQVYNHTMEEIMTAKQKEIILNAIKKIEIDYTDFYHEFDGDRRGFCTITKQIEAGEYDVELIITEEVEFQSHEDYEFSDITIESLFVSHNGEEIESDNITEKEIFKVLKY